MSEFKKIVVDIDGTLCEETHGLEYECALPKQDVIDKVNSYYLAGFEVTIFTARGMYRYNGDGALADRELRKITERWLKNNGVMYHRLLFGKPSADKYIDDKGIRPDEFVKLL